MKDFYLYLITCMLTIACSMHYLNASITLLFMYTYFPLDRITRERCNKIRLRFSNWIIDRYVRIQLFLYIIAVLHSFLHPIESSVNIGFFTIVLNTIYEVLMFQGFLMGYWNKNPFIGIILNSILYTSLFIVDNTIVSVPIVLLQTLMDNLVLERYSIQRILFTKIFIRLLLYSITVRELLMLNLCFTP